MQTEIHVLYQFDIGKNPIIQTEDKIELLYNMST